MRLSLVTMITNERVGLHLKVSNQLFDPLARVNLPLDHIRRAALPSLTASERLVIHARIRHEGSMAEVASRYGMTAKTMHGHLLAARQKMLFSETASLLIWLLIERVDISRWGASS